MRRAKRLRTGRFARADSPTPLTRQNALDSSKSRAMHFCSLLDLLEGAPESLEDDGGHARRDDDKIGLTVSLGESMNENAARMLDFDEPNMLLGESNQAFSNQQHDNAVSLFTDEGDGIDSFGIDSLVAHERCPVQNLAPTSSSSACGRAKPRGSPRPCLEAKS